MTDVSPTNRIYLTYKARILAEAKLRLLSKLSHLLIIWYSFLMIVLSVAQASEMVTISYSDVFFAAASIAILAASIYISSESLTKRADEFRACYLELQKIYNSENAVGEKMRLYNEALQRYPNHANRDHEDLIFNTWRHNGTLHDTKGEIDQNFLILIGVVARKGLFWLFVGLLFVGPLFLVPRFAVLN